MKSKLFTQKELAESKGQGLRAKADDPRPSLDNKRITAIRTYINLFCIKHNIEELPIKSFNEAIPGQVSYARKKTKRHLDLKK